MQFRTLIYILPCGFVCSSLSARISPRPQLRVLMMMPFPAYLTAQQCIRSFCCPAERELSLGRFQFCFSVIRCDILSINIIFFRFRFITRSIHKHLSIVGVQVVTMKSIFNVFQFIVVVVDVVSLKPFRRRLRYIQCSTCSIEPHSLLGSLLLPLYILLCFCAQKLNIYIFALCISCAQLIYLSCLHSLSHG